MAKPLDPRLVEILQKYHPEPKKAVWDCHGTWVIYHKAVELIAAAAGVKFYPPEIIVREQATKHVAILVTGALGDKEEWSIGECAPYNNKNGYPFAMAEKRAKDRVVLKLIGLHGEIYSEDEADDFKPQKGKREPDPEPANDEPQEPSDEDLITSLNKIEDVEKLLSWGRKMAAVISGLEDDKQEAVRKAFLKHREELLRAA